MSEQNNDKGGCCDAFGKCCGGSCHTGAEAKPAPAEGADCCGGACHTQGKIDPPPAPPSCGC